MRTKLIRAGVGVLGMALLLSACGGDDGDTAREAVDDAPEEAEEEAPVEVEQISFLQPLPKSMAFYPRFTADALGYFEEEGIEIEWLPSGDIPASVMVPTGQADIGSTTPQTAVGAITQGEDLQIIYEYYQANVFSIIVPEDSDIQSVSDLAGRTVGAQSEAGGGNSVLRAALEDAGIDPDNDVTIAIVGRGGPVVATSLESGRIEAYAGAFNDHVALEVEGISYRDITPEGLEGLPASSMVVRHSDVDERGDVWTRFLRAWSKGTYAGLIEPEVVWILAQDEVPEEVEDEAFGRAFLQMSLRLQEPAVGRDRFGELRPEAWQLVEEQMLATGDIENPLDLDRALNDSMLDAINDWDRAEVEADVAAWMDQHGG